MSGYRGGGGSSGGGGSGTAAGGLLSSGAAMPTTATTKDASVSRTGLCGALQVFATSATPFAASTVGPATLHTYSGTGANGLRETAIQGQYGPAFTWHGRYALRATGQGRTIFGLYSNVTGSIIAAVDSPLYSYVAIQYSTSRGDTNWQFVYRESSAGAANVIDTGVSVTASAVVDVSITASGAGAFSVTMRDPAGAVVFTDSITDGPNDTRQWAEAWVTNVATAPLTVEWYGAALTFTGA